MIRNQAGQAIGAQMVNASTGAAFSGTVTVYITGDNGTQTIGSVGAGVCTSEGNGYFSYAPSQGETNYAHIAFTFIGTGAIPVTVQVATISEATAAAIGATGTSTIEDVLEDMRVLDNELEIDSGGADETRAIAAIGLAVRAFENEIANVPDLLGTIGTIATAADTEATAWPANLLRLDTLWLLDANGKQIREIEVLYATGGHTISRGIFAATAVESRGAPRSVYTNRAHFYWRPLPDAIHSLRIYGLYGRARPTDRTDTFQYPDTVILPVATYAVRLMEIGINDPADVLASLARETFGPAIKALARPIRQGPRGRVYSEVHTT